MTTDSPAFVDLDDLLDIGLTRRQVDYWATRGYLRPIEASPGSGYPRQWPLVECDVARTMMRLTHAGLAVDVAAATARVAIEQKLEAVALADGITITVREVV